MGTTNFKFLGKLYSLNDLKFASVRKTYWEESHSERTLIQDKYGRLFHFLLEEDIRFDGGPDRVDYIWILVENEKDSDTLKDKHRLTITRPPYIVADESGWFRVVEKEGMKGTDEEKNVLSLSRKLKNVVVGLFRRY